MRLQIILQLLTIAAMSVQLVALAALARRLLIRDRRISVLEVELGVHRRLIRRLECDRRVVGPFDPAAAARAPR